MKWHVGIVGIHQEALACRGLEAKGFEVYCPLGKRMVKHARKQIVKQFPAFSRYIFIRFDDYSAACEPIKSTDGVLDILSNNWQPMEVPCWIIDDIRQREQAGEFDRLPEPKKKVPKWQKSFEILKELLNPQAVIQV